MDSLITQCHLFLQVIYWNPSPEAFTIPFLDIAVRWYSIFFAIGFVGAYFFVANNLFRDCLRKNHLVPLQEVTRYGLFSGKISSSSAVSSARDTVLAYADRLAWFLFAGILIGARLAEVLFYDFDYYKGHPIEIVKVWKGGLASHGGVIGMFVGFILFWHYAKKTMTFTSWKRLIDLICIASAFTAGCIRIGNLFNQEILGTPTSLPWGFIFGHPLVEQCPMPCHPVQLYEALFYFMTFGIFSFLEKKRGARFSPLFIGGSYLTTIFVFRFFIEYFKAAPETYTMAHLSMGQLLSFPLVFIGIAGIFFSRKTI